MSGLWRTYLSVLQRHPWKTQAATTGTLMAAGDVVAQIYIEKKNTTNYDTIRTLRFLGFGTLIAGPALRTWYMTLDVLFKGTTKTVALKKVFCDQAFFAPSFLTFFITTMGYLRGDPWSDIKVKLKRDLVPILIANYQLWIPVQISNFYFVPFQHRVLVVNIVALFWNTYIAWKSERKLATADSTALDGHSNS